MTRTAAIEHLKFAAELGIRGISRDPVWRTRSEGMISTRADETEPAPPASSTSTEVHPVIVSASAADALVRIRTEIGDCTRCKLHRLGRRQIVFGVGNPDADLMFVGEAPGADEDVQGEPFV